MTCGTDGDIIVDGVAINNPVTSAQTQTCALVCDVYTNEAAKAKRVHIKNVAARGQASLTRWEMPVQHLLFKNIDWVQNAVTADTSTPIFRIFDQQTFVGTVGGFGLVELDLVKMRSERVTYGEFTLGGMAATSKVSAFGCWSSPDGGAGFTQFARQGVNAAGSKLITDGLTEQALDGAVALTSGRNYRYPTGARGLTV